MAGRLQLLADPKLVAVQQPRDSIEQQNRKREKGRV
jgi:hypothetical protein